MDRELIIRRRVIGPAELRLVRRLIEQEGAQGRSHLSNRLCELWDWRQANGRFRQIACRELLRRLEAKGLVRLPPPLAKARRPGYRNATRLPERLEREPLEGSLSGFAKDIRICLVEGAEASRAYAGLIGAYHYLGYRQATGAQLKYWVRLGDRPLACLSFGPAAWKLAARDRYIGWSAPTRQARLSDRCYLSISSEGAWIVFKGAHVRSGMVGGFSCTGIGAVFASPFSVDTRASMV